MRVVFRMSAIVAALAVAMSAGLSGCGQSGPLYLPTVPPLPTKPMDPGARPAAPADSSDADDMSGDAASLKLAPADTLRTTPASGNAQHNSKAAARASSAASATRSTTAQ